MGEIRDCTKALIQAILDSKEYRKFNDLKEEVQKDPELRRQINEFRLHVFEIQNSQNPLDMFDEQQRISRKYEEFRKNPLVNEFLLAELSVCRILQKVTGEVANAIDLDTDDIAERIGI